SASSYPTRVHRDGRLRPVLVPIAAFPAEVEAMAILAQIDGETERKKRYIDVHSAYEAVVPNRAIHLSAVRHALAHPMTSLTRPNVKAALAQHFAGAQIDLSLNEHKKVYYRCLVE